MMTKYEHLLKAVADARKRDADYFARAYQLARGLVQALRTDLAPPDEQKDCATLLPIDPTTGLFSATGEKPPFSPKQLLRLDESNRYHVGMVLTIGPKEDGPARLMFHLMLEELEGTTFGVRYAEALPPIIVDTADPLTFSNFATLIYETALKHFNDEVVDGGPLPFVGDIN